MALAARCMNHSVAHSRHLRLLFSPACCQWAVKEARPHSLAVIDELIAAGLSLATVNAAGTTALHWSVHSDSDEIITGIIHRLCPGVKDSQHTPPTPAATTQHTAARRQLPVCDALLAKNERNETALHWAVDWQKPVAVSTLLRLADGSRSSVSAATTASRDLVHVADVNGDTPLHRLPIDCPSSAACRLIAQQLIARGANVTAENKAHRTPLAHFPTPTDEGHAGDGRERAVLRDAGALEELDEQAEEFKRNVTQQFDTV